MKTRFLALVVMLAALGGPCFASAVHLTADVSANFLGGSTTQQIVNTFSIGDQPLFWGLGWEVILGRVGFGGDYMVDFFKDAASQWWLDWYAPALYLSFHPIGANHVIDPFVQAGIGSAGRVLLRHMAWNHGSDLMISIFPYVAGGLNLNLDGLLLGLKATYTPFNAEIPVTSIPAYPLGTFQVALSLGFSIGW
jgi:hypothetical protein